MRRVLERVHELTATEVLEALSFAAGTVRAPVARVVQQAIAEAERTLGVHGEELVVTGGEVGGGETVTRVRRLAHGMADWITTQTTDIRIELSVARSRKSDPQ